MMEYMDGGSLQDIVDHGGCDDEETLATIAQQSLYGLAFLHGCSQLHRYCQYFSCFHIEFYFAIHLI